MALIVKIEDAFMKCEFAKESGSEATPNITYSILLCSSITY